MADVDPDSPASCHATELEQNDKPPEVPEIVSAAAIHSGELKYDWINSIKNQTTEQIRKVERAYVWHNEDLIDDLECDVADLDSPTPDSQTLEEEILVEDDLADFEASQHDVPRKINPDDKDTKKTTLPTDTTALVKLIGCMELMNIQNHEIHETMKKLISRIDVLENRLIHAQWDPEGAVDDMYKRHGKSGRPKTAWEKRQAEAAKKAQAQAPTTTMPKNTSPAGKSELEIQQTTLMQYQQHKQMMSEAMEREMIERALVESQHVYTRLGMPESVVSSSRTKPPVSIAGFFDDPTSKPKKETGFGEPGKYA